MKIFQSTLIHKLAGVATSAETADAASVECCGDVLSYREVLTLSLSIADDLRLRFGRKPTVAIISENHPYVLAVIFATWLLGGVASPLDRHVPEPLLRGMLEGVRPSCVVLPENSGGNLAVVQDMGFPVITFSLAESGIPHLVKRFHVDAAEAPTINPDELPTPADDALYLYTSSASSASNLKCVPISHGALYANCCVKIAAFRAMHEHSSARPRVLGWGPMSHIMALSHDVGALCILAAGCYVFGVPPTSYPRASNSEDVGQPGGEYDAGAVLLRTAARARTTTFTGVPWVLRRFMEECARRPEYVEVLRGFDQVLSGGARTDDDIVQWAKANGIQLDVGIGMTELSGSLFQARVVDMVGDGYPISSCLIAEATLSLIDESGIETQTTGELVVRSRYMSKGYRNFSSAAHSTYAEGVTTFRTGDVYSLANGRLTWEGRREDYIQLASAELLDPRIPEKALAENPYIARAALVGNAFLRGAAEYVCAIVEVPTETGFKAQEVMRAFTEVNKVLSPPLRVPFARVLVLKDGEVIPVTKKGLVWRKALEEKFGERMKALLANPGLSRLRERTKGGSNGWTARPSLDVKVGVESIVADALGLSKEQMSDNQEATFAELGMDSNMAISIVSALNARFGIELPMNACHDHVDLAQLSKAVFANLHRTNQEANQQPKSLPTAGPSALADDVVIVGQAFRLPGKVSDVDSFWKALVDQREDLLEPLSNDRWDHSSFYAPPGSPEATPGTYIHTKTGRIEVASYDNGFFGISTSEAYYVCPTARIALEVAVEALEDANIPLSAIKGKKAGIFIAVAPQSGYSELVFEDKGYSGYGRHFGAGLADSAVCGRLSYFLDVHGPSVSINTACSSGMVAFDNAARSIRDGSSELAVVCSVNVHVWPGSFSFQAANQMSSMKGRCATFTKDADGYAPSEGSVAFILKRKSAALRDGDNILAVVKSTSVQHNGRSQGLVAPSSKAQAELQRTILSDAGLAPSDIDFVETHGTGTILGDMLEIQALNEVFVGSHSSESPLVLGAAKTVFGHTESTAGLVGIAKAIQTMRHSVLPGLAHLDDSNLNPRLDTSASPFKIPHEAVSLKRRTGEGRKFPHRALVMAYGFAGTISGTALEEYRRGEESEPLRPDEGTSKASSTYDAPSHLFVVSAKTEKALLEYIRKYIDFCSEANESELADICYTTCVGREHYRFRFACICTSLKELVERLSDVLSSKMTFAAVPPTARIAFAFPGQGSQWQGMARSLSDVDDVFSSYLLDYAGQASELLGIDLNQFLLDDVRPATSGLSIDDTRISQPCIFVFQCAMMQWLLTIGIHPSAVLAHSLGEIAAAVCSESVDFRTALEFVVIRGQSMHQTASPGGAMAALRSRASVISDCISGLGLSSSVNIAAFNSDTQHVISGDGPAIHQLVSKLSSKAIKCKILPVSQGFHSHCIDSSLGPIQEWLDRNVHSLGQPRIPYYSSVEGRLIQEGENLDDQYWIHQARQPVLFSSAGRAMMDEDKCDGVIDIGPQNIVANLLEEYKSQDSPSISSLFGRPAINTLSQLMQGMATLFMIGVTPDFQRLYTGRHLRANKIPIPTYPWQRQRHYPAVIPSRTGSSKGSYQNGAYSKSWEIGKELGPVLENNHTLHSVPIIPAAALAMYVSLEARKARPGNLDIDLRIMKSMFLETPGEDVLKLDIRGESFSCAHFQGSVEKDVICSGKLRPAPPVPSSPSFITVGDEHPISTMDNGQTYRKLGKSLVRFGSTFQSVQKVDIYRSSAVGHIKVPTTGDVQGDFVRKLDACIHMLGTVTPEVPPALSATGCFLPSALNGFTIHSDSFPDKIICRYRLPVTVAPNSRKMTATFEVCSDTGTLLASCAEYSVAWIPYDLPLVGNGEKAEGLPLIRTTWVHKPLESMTTELSTFSSSSELVYVGSGSMKDALKNYAKSNSLNLHIVDNVASFFSAADCELCSRTSSNPKSYQHSRWCTKNKGSFYIILDAIPFNCTHVTTGAVISSSTAALDFVKAVAPHLRSQKIASVIALTQNALQTIQSDAPLLQNTAPLSSSLLGSFVHGMIRVLRQEASSQLVSVLDVPTSIVPREICALVLREFDNTSCGKSSPIAYRLSEDHKLVRLEPRLVEHGHWTPFSNESSREGRKCAVIIGMGDIGAALAKKMVVSGWSSIVFIGRRGREDVQVTEALADLEYNEADVRYMQADVTSYSSIRGALERICADLGPIYSIVHTASVIKDSLIGNTSLDDFISVMKPKALGAWNLHIACEELKIDIKRFILLSSVSVPLGNPGQVSYVASNAFLDALAVYRSSIAPPASTSRSFSIQLGAWESRVTAGLRRDESSDAAVLKISHDEGIPLLMSVIDGEGNGDALPVVSMLAKMRFEKLRGKGTYETDPYFGEVIKKDVGDSSSSLASARSGDVSLVSVVDFVILHVRGILGMSPDEDLEPASLLLSLGVDSISFTELRADIFRQFKVDIPLSFLGEDTLTLEDMAKYIIDKAKRM